MTDLNSTDKDKIVVTYVPHGIDPQSFKPVNVPDEFRKKILNGKEYEFIVLWSNRNIRRKQPSDVIWAFNNFVESLDEDKRDTVCLIMHTQPIDENGTDLFAVKEAIAPKCNIIFSTNRMDTPTLNYLYNVADVTINIAGNEGFGLTTAESVMSGTPIIVNVTGGLQDQCGFKRLVDVNENHGKWVEFTAGDYIEIGSLHEYKKWEKLVKHGNWVKPVWSRAQTMVGSVPTPYIIDDKVDIDDVTDAITYWYNINPTDRNAYGEEGRNWMINQSGLTSQAMCTSFMQGMDLTFEHYKPRKRYKVYKVK